MLAALACGSLQVGTMESKQLLMSRGLTRREADNVEARHRRRNKAPLEVAELSLVLDSLDALELMPEQAAHLLRSTPLNELLATTTEGDPKERLWCSYKKQLCDCGARPGTAAAASARGAPRVVAVDCEFKPLRVAAVDEAGRVRLDSLVLAPEQSGTPAKSKGMLGCDIAATPVSSQSDARASVLALLTAGGPGCTWLAHTPQHDLRMLGLAEEELAAAGVRLVDIGALGVAPGEQVRSLKHMARALLSIEIHAGGQRHCAVQDAYVTLQLYAKLRDVLDVGDADVGDADGDDAPRTGSEGS